MFLGYFDTDTDGDFHFEDKDKLNGKHIIFDDYHKAMEVLIDHLETAYETVCTTNASRQDSCNLFREYLKDALEYAKEWDIPEDINTVRNNDYLIWIDRMCGNYNIEYYIMKVDTYEGTINNG